MIAYSALDTNLLNLLRSFVNDPAYPTSLRQAGIKQSIQALATGSIFGLSKIDIPELQETELWNVVPTTTIITATKGATTLTVPSTVGYPTSGTLFTQLGVITYTGTTSTTFTGIPASGAGSIKANILAGQNIYYLYPLPTDFASVSNVYLGQLWELMYMEYRKLLNGVSIGSIGNYSNYGYGRNNQDGNVRQQYSAKLYSIIQGKYLFYPYYAPSTEVLTLQYQVMPQITFSGNVPLLWDDWEETIIYAAAAYIKKNRGEVEDGMAYDREGAKKATEVYRRSMLKNGKPQKPQRVRTASDRLLAI